MCFQSSAIYVLERQLRKLTGAERGQRQRRDRDRGREETGKGQGRDREGAEKR